MDLSFTLWALVYAIVGIAFVIVDTMWAKYPWLYVVAMVSFPHEGTLGPFFVLILVLCWPVIPFGWLVRGVLSLFRR